MTRTLLDRGIVIAVLLLAAALPAWAQAPAPELTAGKWLNGDGTYAFIVNTVQTGVPNPQQSPAAMPPMGGMNLTGDQIRAVAPMVYWLSRSKTRTD
jgi:hypothetical protein